MGTKQSQPKQAEPYDKVSELYSASVAQLWTLVSYGSYLCTIHLLMESARINTGTKYSQPKPNNKVRKL